jgi:hypothetical protein
MSEAPPADQPKKAKDMNSDERAAALKSIKRGPPPTPIETEKRAIDMSELERREYLAEHKKRYGL